MFYFILNKVFNYKRYMLITLLVYLAVFIFFGIIANPHLFHGLNVWFNEISNKDMGVLNSNSFEYNYFAATWLNLFPYFSSIIGSLILAIQLSKCYKKNILQKIVNNNFNRETVKKYVIFLFIYISVSYFINFILFISLLECIFYVYTGKVLFLTYKFIICLFIFIIVQTLWSVIMSFYAFMNYKIDLIKLRYKIKQDDPIAGVLVAPVGVIMWLNVVCFNLICTYNLYYLISVIFLYIIILLFYIKKIKKMFTIDDFIQKVNNMALLPLHYR